MPRNIYDSYDFGQGYSGRNRRNNFSGVPEDPTASNTRHFLEQAGTFEQPLETNAGPPEPSTPSWGNWMAEMRDAYTKEGPAQSAYREHLNTMPQYQTPSKWQKFGAALVGGAEGLRAGGAAGWKAGQEAAEAPYRRELEQWGLQEQGLGRQAALEEKASGRRIEFMNQVRQTARDEAQAAKMMRDYDLNVQKEKNDEAHRAKEVARWDRQDLETYTGADGNLYERLPGSSGPGRLVGSTLEGAQFGETKRSHRVNEKTAQGQLGVSQGQLDLGRERESRIASTPMDPRAQSSARTSALSRAAAEKPEWTKFFDAETGSIVPPSKNDPNSWEWQEFKKFNDAVQKHEGGIFSRPRFPPIIEY